MVIDASATSSDARQQLVEQGVGQFLAEAGQLVRMPALVDGHAEGEVETILIPLAGLRALLVAEARLGERITRALILRRVAADPERALGGPLIVGEPERRGRGAARQLLRPQRTSLHGR